LERAALLLGEYPYMGRPGREPGYREFVAHANYIMVFTVLETQVDIVSVVHARRRYP